MKNPFAPEATSYEEDLEYKMLGDAVFAYMRKEQMYVFDEDEWVDFVGSLFEEECKAAFRRVSEEDDRPCTEAVHRY